MTRATWPLVVLLLGALWACDDSARPLNEASEPRDEEDAGGGAGGAGSEGGGGGDDGQGGGQTPVPPGGICGPGNTRCVEGRLQTCQADARSYLVEPCDEGELCEDGACIRRACEPGARQCDAAGQIQQCAEDGRSWIPGDVCADGRACVEGACLEALCRPGETACAAKVKLTCEADGLHWAREPCETGTRCIDGECVADVPQGDCPPGEILCAPGGLRVCNAEGTGYTETPCGEGEVCFGEACVQCVRDENCDAGLVCDQDGLCIPAPLSILTERLPAGQVGLAYDVLLEATGGTPPYAWRLEVGRLPPGLAVTGDGHLAGTPEDIAEVDLSVEVTDAVGGVDTRQLRLRIVGAGASLEITTESPLPDAEEGSDYEQQFEAIGGEAPYGFFLVGGATPAGLVLDATGRLAGTPTEVGHFEFRLRAVDAGTPPGFAEKDFAIDITVAPLEIYGDQELDLFVAKLITLPLITIIPNVPIPYDTQLMARGGLRPHTWTEQPLPDLVAGFIPNSGIPDGLVLDPDGRLHGAVADASQVVSVTIPFVNFTLTGYFFAAEVRDSQNPADSATAIFIVPTLPLGG